MSLSDEDLIEGIKKGGFVESKAIENLYEKNRARILSFIRYNSSTVSAKEPEDVLWEAIEALIQNIKADKYKAQAGVALGAYLMGIAKNLWLKQLSSEQARSNRQTSYFAHLAEIQFDVSELISEKEVWDKYLAIFEEAGKNCKRILQMVYGLGYSIKELAEVFIEEGVFENEQVFRNAKSKCLKRVKNRLSAINNNI